MNDPTNQSGLIPKSQVFPVKGGNFIFHPKGSQYPEMKDNKATGNMITRQNAVIQYQPRYGKINLAQCDIENFELLISSKQLKEWLPQLPEQVDLEPDTIQ